MYINTIDLVAIGMKTAQFILSFSILVVLHELGHFIPARLFKTRVEKFYLFFNPGFSLWKKKIGETEYGIGWIPFGGYVKISGMIDESMDKEQLKKEPENWELRSKPAYQRLIVMLGGVIVNVLLAIVIFIGLSWVYGDDNLPGENVSYGLHVNAIAKSIGLQEGDKIIRMDHQPIEDISAIEASIVQGSHKTLQVQRGDSSFDLTIPSTLSASLASTQKSESMPFIMPRIPIIVDSIGKSAVTMDGTVFLKGDTVIAINQKEVKYRLDFENIKKKYADSIVVVSVLRGADTVNIKALINGSGQLGVFLKMPGDLFTTVHKEFGLVQSIPFGIKRTFTTLNNYVQGIKQIFTGKVNPNDSLGSLISIGNTFPSFWDWEKFWTLTGVFSIILAFMNVLPIPALDGGHALFILFEMITGRKPSDKFMEYAQITGMLIMFGLMFYALGLDFWRLFK